MTIKLTILALLFVIAPYSTASAPFGDIPTPEPEPQTLQEYAEEVANQYGVDFTLLSKVINCESGWNPEAYNPELHPDGTIGSIGIAQFKPETFYAFADEMGIEGEPTNPEDAIKVMAWAFSTGKGRHWTCYRKFIS